MTLNAGETETGIIPKLTTRHPLWSMSFDNIRHSPVDSRRIWSDNRTQTGTSFGDSPNADRPYWWRAPRPERRTAPLVFRLWCSLDAVRDGPSPCTRSRWSPVSRLNGIWNENAVRNALWRRDTSDVPWCVRSCCCWSISGAEIKKI